MANFSRPTDVPRWADVGGNLTVATEGQKDTGWLDDQAPPAGVQNEWQNLVGEWMKWFEERVADGVNNDEFVLNRPSAGTKSVSLDDNGLRVLDGLVVGFDQTPTNDRIQLGDATCQWANDGSTVTLSFDSGDFMQYNRTTNSLRWVIGLSTIAVLSATELLLNTPLNAASGVQISGPSTLTDDLVVGTGGGITLDVGGVSLEGGSITQPAGEGGGIFLSDGQITTDSGLIFTTSGNIQAATGDIVATTGQVLGATVKTLEQGIQHADVEVDLPLPFGIGTGPWDSNTVNVSTTLPLLNAQSSQDLALILPLKIGDNLKEVHAHVFDNNGAGGPIAMTVYVGIAQEGSPPGAPSSVGATATSVTSANVQKLSAIALGASKASSAIYYYVGFTGADVSPRAILKVSYVYNRGV